MEKIVDRQGKIVDFDSERIENAIKKASDATKEFDGNEAKKLTKNVIKILKDYVAHKELQTNCKILHFVS